MGLGRYLDSCGNFIKYTLFFINLTIFLGGIAVVALGIWIAVDKSFATSILGTNLYIGAVYVLIAAGILVSIISCFGCFGAAQEVRCMLITYFIAVFLIFVTMLVAGILGYVFRAKAEDDMKKGLGSLMESYNRNKESRELWDELQSAFKCCGIDSYHNWKPILYNNLPDSCCKPTVPGVQNQCTEYNVYQQGCFPATIEYVRTHAAIIGGAGIGVACIMLLGMIFSCVLFNMID